MNLARSFSKLDRFFYPHNFDFRGRVYPIPPHLNHIGNDLSRGLLLFADGKRLGKSGFRWLKIHCANLMGKDKDTVEGKLQFIEANLSLIHDIATDPLKNREWLHNEDCWQSLAAIFELHEAIISNDPENYVSCIHVHQDGSCNGLQHYAALGRD
jgi:DNA-directed RNA polymerase